MVRVGRHRGAALKTRGCVTRSWCLRRHNSRGGRPNAGRGRSERCRRSLRRRAHRRWLQRASSRGATTGVETLGLAAPRPGAAPAFSPWGRSTRRTGDGGGPAAGGTRSLPEYNSRDNGRWQGSAHGTCTATALIDDGRVVDRHFLNRRGRRRRDEGRRAHHRGGEERHHGRRQKERPDRRRRRNEIKIRRRWRQKEVRYWRRRRGGR